MATVPDRSTIEGHLPVPQWVLPAIVSVLIGYLAWYALATVFPEDIMPYPLEALGVTWGLVRSGVVLPHLVATLKRTLLAFVGAMVLGTILGILMGGTTYFKQFLLPYVLILLALPAIAAAVIAMLIFRFSILSPVVGTILITLPFVTINIWEGVEGIDPDLLEVGESFGLSRWRSLRRIVLPQIAPMLFSTIRFAFSVAIRVVTIAEIVASSSGIGYMIIQTYQRYQFADAWAWAIIFMVVLLVLEYGILEPIERRVFAYRRDVDIG